MDFHLKIKVIIQKFVFLHSDIITAKNTFDRWATPLLIIKIKDY